MVFWKETWWDMDRGVVLELSGQPPVIVVSGGVWDSVFQPPFTAVLLPYPALSCKWTFVHAVPSA